MKDHNIKTKRAALQPLFRIWSCGAFRVETLADAPSAAYEPVKTAQWGGSNYPRLLLKALLCCPGRRARREILLGMLWPEAKPEQAAQYLHTATTKLRRLLRPAKGQPSLLLTEDHVSSYRLEEQTFLWVDFEAALFLLRDVEHLGRTHVDALPLLEEAAKYLNRGAFLEGEDGQWVQKQRKSIEALRYRCQLWLAEAYEKAGMPGLAETLLSTMLADDPTDEDVLCRLLSLLRQLGMVHKGRRLYEETQYRLQANGQQLLQTTRAQAEQILSELSNAERLAEQER
jgi:DNA-binding SARP family transcriptional activator